MGVSVVTVLAVALTAAGAMLAGNIGHVAERAANQQKRVQNRRPNAGTAQLAILDWWRANGILWFATGVGLLAWLGFDAVGLHFVGLAILAVIGAYFLAAGLAPEHPVTRAWYHWASINVPRSSSPTTLGIVLLAIAIWFTVRR